MQYGFFARQWKSCRLPCKGHGSSGAMPEGSVHSLCAFCVRLPFSWPLPKMPSTPISDCLLSLS